MTASPRNLALAAVVASYLALLALLGAAAWDDHVGGPAGIGSTPVQHAGP
jgi:hypothetical protein